MIKNHNSENRFQRLAEQKKSPFKPIALNQEDLVASRYGRYIGAREKSVVQAAKKRDTFALWVSGFGQFLHQGRQNQNPTFNANTGGVLIGMDAFQNIDSGVSVGYSRSSISQDATSYMNCYFSSIYGTFYAKNFYFELNLSGEYNQYRNKRKVIFPGFEEVAKSKNSGYQVMPYFEIGYDLSFDWGVLEPFSSADYIYVYESSFSEKGAAPLNMHINSRSFSMLRGEIGLNAYQNWKMEWGSIFIRESVSYANQQPFGVGKMNALLVGSPPGFAVNSLNTALNLFRSGLELFIRGNSGLFGSVSYTGEYGSRYYSNAVFGEIGQYF